MPYIIKDYNSSNVRLVIGDGVVDNSTSLNLVGKNVSNFGALQNENFLYLLENFANSSSPVNPVNGQLWYDQTNLNYYNQGVWTPVAVITTDQSVTQTGALYLNQTSNQLYVSTGTGFSLVGPEGVPGRGTTRMYSTTLKDIFSQTHPVVKIIVDEETIGIISKVSFVLDSSNIISGFPSVNRGITFKNQSTNDVILNGRTANSNMATTATNVAAGAAGSLVYQSAVGATTYLGIGTANTLLTSNGSAPYWQTIDSVTVKKANNLSNGLPGSIPYQTASSSTSFLNLSNIPGYLLTAGITGPVWTNPTSFAVSSATNSIHATTAEIANTSTYAATAIRALESNQVSWSAVYGKPTTIAGYGITDAITKTDIANQSVTTATMVLNKIGRDNSTYGSVSGQWTLEAGATFYATYADLAEKYLPDEDYQPGTVLSFGGINEITLSTTAMDTAVAGIVSTNPAYALNQGLVGGIYIALAGRVPCKVIGPIKKGDLLVTSKIPGVATRASNVSLFGPKTGSVIGKAIESYDESAIVGVIQVMVKSA
jgi:hypothetical protein